MIPWVIVGETRYRVERPSAADVHFKFLNTTELQDFGVFIDKEIRAERGLSLAKGPSAQ